MYNTGIFFLEWDLSIGKWDFEKKLAWTLLNGSHFRNSTFTAISAQLKRETTVPFPPLSDVPGMRIFA